MYIPKQGRATNSFANVTFVNTIKMLIKNKLVTSCRNIERSVTVSENLAQRAKSEAALVIFLKRIRR